MSWAVVHRSMATNEAELETWQTRQGLRMFCENWLAGSNLLARVSVKLAASGDPCVYMYCTEHEDCQQARCHFLLEDPLFFHTTSFPLRCRITSPSKTRC